MPSTISKMDFYKFAISMKESSNTLFERKKYHSSVYLGVYVLEGYIKIILLHKDSPDYRGHLGDKDFLKRFRQILDLYPEFSDNILQPSHPSHPKRLFNGQGNNTTKAAWNINHRYRIDNWTDSNFCESVQQELEGLRSALSSLRIDGVL